MTSTDLITSCVECTLNYAHSYVHKIVKGETTIRFNQFKRKQRKVQLHKNGQSNERASKRIVQRAMPCHTFVIHIVYISIFMSYKYLSLILNVLLRVCRPFDMCIEGSFIFTFLFRFQACFLHIPFSFGLDIVLYAVGVQIYMVVFDILLMYTTHEYIKKIILFLIYVKQSVHTQHELAQAEVEKQQRRP